MDRVRAGGRISAVSEQEAVPQSELPGAKEGGRSIILNPWTSGTFWTSVSQVKNPFFRKEAKLLWDKTKGLVVFFFRLM